MQQSERRAASKVRRLDRADTLLAVSALADAFHDYPVIRYVLGASRHDDDQRLSTLLEFFVTARMLRKEPVLAVPAAEGLAGVALVSYPDDPSPDTVANLREEVWAKLGSEARRRYEQYGAATQRFFTDRSRVHLNMIGVRRGLRGSGLGGQLLAEVHRLAEDMGAPVVTLTTENPANLPLYEHFGYEIVAEAMVAPELRTWGLVRRP